MSDIDEKEQKLFVKHIIRQLVKEQLNELHVAESDNNHGVFLERRTFNWVLLYMLMKETGGTNEEIDRSSEMKVVEKLEQVIADNKQEFDEVIILLKDLP